jgi:hypothetical protein
MSAVAGDLDPVTGVRAALAAVFLVARHDAPARRVRTFLRLKMTHGDLSVLSKQSCRIRAEHPTTGLSVRRIGTHK